jgi:hypothetical protein
MFGQVIRALLYICLMALLFYIIVWVLASIGFALPPMVEKILIVMFVLVCILILYQLFAPWLGGINWWGRGPGPCIILAVSGTLAPAAMFLTITYLTGRGLIQ